MGSMINIHQLLKRNARVKKMKFLFSDLSSYMRNHMGMFGIGHKEEIMQEKQRTVLCPPHQKSALEKLVGDPRRLNLPDFGSKFIKEARKKNLAQEEELVQVVSLLGRRGYGILTQEAFKHRSLLWDKFTKHLTGGFTGIITLQKLNEERSEELRERGYMVGFEMLIAEINDEVKLWTHCIEYRKIGCRFAVLEVQDDPSDLIKAENVAFHANVCQGCGIVPVFKFSVDVPSNVMTSFYEAMESEGVILESTMLVIRAQDLTQTVSEKVGGIFLSCHGDEESAILALREVAKREVSRRIGFEITSEMMEATWERWRTSTFSFAQIHFKGMCERMVAASLEGP